MNRNGPPQRAVSVCSYRLRVAVAGLIVLLLGSPVALAGSLALLAGFLATALLLSGLLTRRLILLAGLVLVRHVVSFHGNADTTAWSSCSFLTKKRCCLHCRRDATVSLTYSGAHLLILRFSLTIKPG